MLIQPLTKNIQTKIKVFYAKFTHNLATSYYIDGVLKLHLVVRRSTPLRRYAGTPFKLAPPYKAGEVILPLTNIGRAVYIGDIGLKTWL